jgi:hypothetical protein
VHIDLRCHAAATHDCDPRSHAIVPTFLRIRRARCASEPSFYSFASRAFVPLEQVPARTDLVGTWRRNDGGDLVLRPDGKFSMGPSSGCWDVDRRRLLLRPACVNYGATNNSAILAIAESTDERSFTLTTNHLQIRNCSYAA